MIAPIDVACPCCSARAGAPCTEWLNYREGAWSLFHHAARVDAAARSGVVGRVLLEPRQELSDADVDASRVEDLREAYRSLRDRHVREITGLGRVEHMRRVFDAAIDWRKHVTLIASEPLTQKVLDAIDAAIDAEEAAATKRSA